MWIYGKNPVKDIFNNKKELLLEVYIDDKKHQKLSDELKELNIKVYSLKKINYLKFFPTENVQGIVAKIKEPHFFDLNIWLSKSKKENPVILILDQIMDPQNFGAILRNAAAFEVDAVIFSDRKSSPFNATVIKTSAGTWYNVDLIKTNSLTNSLNILKSNDFWIASTSLDGDKNLNDLNDFKNYPLSIILGNEGKGVRKSFLDKSDIKVKINMSKKVESLNVASTSALILFNVMNERK